jgi:hypothetical protein
MPISFAKSEVKCTISPHQLEYDCERQAKECGQLGAITQSTSPTKASLEVRMEVFDLLNSVNFEVRLSPASHVFVQA